MKDEGRVGGGGKGRWWGPKKGGRQAKWGCGWERMYK